MKSESKAIPYGRQSISEEDIEAVVSALKSDYLTQGPTISEFEQKFADYVQAKYAVAVTNGTAALHLAAMALNVQPGDRVITTPITFAASANCVRYCGGEVHFADIDPNTYLLDLKKVADLIASKPKGFYKGVIPVDFAGRALDTQSLRQLAGRHGLWIIEDACHSPGGYFVDSEGKQQLCGSGNFADITVFSFHPVKHIATGEGGMLTTNSEELYHKLKTLRTHGITREHHLFTNSIALAIGDDKSSADKGDWPGWYMEMQELGYNYRLTDFQAALGISQLKKADKGLTRRREIAKIYNRAFSGKPWLKSQSGEVDGHAYHLYVIEVSDRLGLYNELKRKNIFPQVHYVPVHLMPYYRQFGFDKGDFPQAEQYYNHCLSLPMYPTLTDAEQQRVIDAIIAFYE